MNRNITTLNLLKTTVYKLQSLGKNNCDDLTESDRNNFSIDLSKIPPSINSLEFLEEELLNGAILSLNTDLDTVLKDEITPKRITELAGFPGSGKTQICFQLSVTTQLPKRLGGVEGQVIYISTNKNFSSHRVRELSRTFIKRVGKVDREGLTEETILKNIYVFTISSAIELCAMVNVLKDFLNDKMVKLLIIDSISSPLRDVDPKDRSPFTYKLFGDFQNLAETFNFAIVITNDFTTRVKNNEAYYTPSFGDGFFDRVNSRICLSRHPVDNIYVAELVKSVAKAPVKVNFSMF